MKRKIINVGDKFGKLTVIREVEPNLTPCGTKQRKFLCKCECGKEIISTMANFRNKYADCGCLKRYIKNKKRKYKGRIIESYLYTTYQGMMRRCYDFNFEKYKKYGARGIVVCDEWKSDFFSFYDWAILNGASENLTIDRIDNNGNYCPENCRWVDLFTQANNKSSNRVLEYNGESHTIMEWSRKIGCNESKIRYRLNHGKTIGQALGYEPYNYKVGHKKLSFNGESLTPAEWSKKTGIPSRLITLRLSRGYSIEESLSVRRFKLSKSIIEYDADGNYVREWNDSKEVAEFYNLSISAIHYNCNNNGTTRFGAKFRYKE